MRVGAIVLLTLARGLTSNENPGGREGRRRSRFPDPSVVPLIEVMMTIHLYAVLPHLFIVETTSRQILSVTEGDRQHLARHSLF